jgi:type VI secretion system protein VasG
LKPALARGNLRTIGATTWAEYKKYIEKDPALTRRFQVVQVLEPNELKAILMLRGVAATLEKHHRVLLLDAAIEAAVRLSHRYIPARQLPDKAVSLLDTACARVAVSQHATPPDVEDCIRRIEALTIELEIIGREETIGLAIGDRKAQATNKLESEKQLLQQLDTRWKEEKALVDEIIDLRGKLRAEGAAVDQAAPQGEGESGERGERNQLLETLRERQQQLDLIQGETPLILPAVDEQAVAAVVASWTGIPVGRMMKNEIDAVLNLASTLNNRVIGQRHGLRPRAPS